MLCAMEDDLDFISQESWKEFEKIGAFLKPFAAVTRYMSGSTYPTLAGVVPIFNRLCDHLEDSMTLYESQNDFDEV